MNGGLRAGIAQFDTNGIDAGVFAPGYQRLACLLHHHLVYAAPGHECSYDFVLCYVACNYVLIMPMIAFVSKDFLTWNNHGLSHVRGEFVRLVVLAAVRGSATTRLVSQALCRHHERPVPAPAKSTRYQ